MRYLLIRGDFRAIPRIVKREIFLAHVFASGITLIRQLKRAGAYARSVEKNYDSEDSRSELRPLGPAVGLLLNDRLDLSDSIRNHFLNILYFIFTVLRLSIYFPIFVSDFFFFFLWIRFLKSTPFYFDLFINVRRPRYLTQKQRIIEIRQNRVSSSSVE